MAWGFTDRPRRFTDRRDAGRQLAARLQHLAALHPLILALPRGGVPVAHEVALTLDAPLDVLLVRKIGMPGNPEFALGAVVEGQPPQHVIHEDLAARCRVPAGWIEAEEARQLALIAQRGQRWRQGAPFADVRGRTVILVDDGMATGSTATAALMGLVGRGAARTVLAVPVAPADALDRLPLALDDFVCLWQPDDLVAVGEHYRDFRQTEDEEVTRLLALHHGRARR